MFYPEKFRLLTLRSLFIVAILSISGGFTLAQASLDEVNMEQIPYRKVREYLLRQKQNRIEFFQDMRASNSAASDQQGFSSYSRSYLIKAQKKRVWHTYKNVSPTESWKNRKSRLGLLYSRETDEVKYANDTCGGVRRGQVLYVHLRLMRGIYKLATAFEITRVEEGLIEFSYIEDGVSEGTQTIEILEEETGYTRVVHTSTIRSKSKFRDKVLYPYFHNRIINEFHRKMKRSVIADEYASSYPGEG